MDDARRASRLRYLILVLALLGVVDAFYDSYSIYVGQPLWCPPPIDGCNTVADSPYARVFGIPLGYIGVLYYFGMALIAGLLLRPPASGAVRAAALIYAGIGLAGSALFFYIQATYIHAFCIYCAISALLTVLLFFTALAHYRGIS